MIFCFPTLQLSSGALQFYMSLPTHTCWFPGDNVEAQKLTDLPKFLLKGPSKSLLTHWWDGITPNSFCTPKSQSPKISTMSIFIQSLLADILPTHGRAEYYLVFWYVKTYGWKTPSIVYCTNMAGAECRGKFSTTKFVWNKARHPKRPTRQSCYIVESSIWLLTIFSKFQTHINNTKPYKSFTPTSSQAISLTFLYS